MSEELTEFLSAEAYRARSLDRLEIPTDIVELLFDYGFETVDDVLDADPVTLPPDVVDALRVAFGGEGISWGATEDGMHAESDRTIRRAVRAILEAYRTFHLAESWPDMSWRVLRSGPQLELRLEDGTTVRGRLSAPLLLAARFRSATLGNEIHEEFPQILSFPQEPMLEEQIGSDLIIAAHLLESEGEHEEAVFCARRALRDVRWIASEDFDVTDIGSAVAELLDPLFEDVVRVAECSARFAQHRDSYETLAEVATDCAGSPDAVERYETAVMLRGLFDEAPVERLIEVSESFFETVHRLATDEVDAVCERALHAAHAAAQKLWEAREYRQALGWLELSLDGGVYPAESLRQIAECRLYIDGEIPEALTDRLNRLRQLDESAYRGPWYDELWRESAHVRVAEALTKKGANAAARRCIEAILDDVESATDRRTKNLLGRACLILGDTSRESDDGEARRWWERARRAFDEANLTSHSRDVASRLSG